MSKEIFSEIALTGKLITSHDPVTIGQNFRVMKNLRYGEKIPEGIRGMTKINTSALETYFKIRNGFHFKKDNPAESHVVVQAFNNAETGYALKENKTVIPSQGAFNDTALYTDASNTNTGRFSDAPNGQMAFCDGEKSLIWGGDEMDIYGFINYDPNISTFLYDYTKQVTNTLQDANNVATLKKSSVTIDAYVKGLFHFDTDLNDTSGSTPPHNATASGAIISTSVKKFGVGSLYFDGVNDYATIANHADLDLSGGIFTLDAQIYLSDVSGTKVIYSHGTDASNYFAWYVDGTGLYCILVVGGIQTTFGNSGWFSAGNWYHVELCENEDTWYMFMQGHRISTYTITGRCKDSLGVSYTGDVYLGYSPLHHIGSNYFKGYIDELRITNGKVQHSLIASFTPPVSAYDTNIYTYIRVQTTRAIKGVKFYVKTANTGPGLGATGYYWDGSKEVPLTTFVDNTANGNITLANPGTITFDTTVDLAKPRYYNQVYGYWYTFRFQCDETTQIYYVTADCPMQAISDLWDGEYRKIGAAKLVSLTANSDYTLNLREDDYDEINDGTYANLASMLNTSYILIGFTERMAALYFGFVGTNTNAVVTTAKIYYWNGADWTLVSDINDNTKENNASFARNGVISWTPPDETSEFTLNQYDANFVKYYDISLNKPPFLSKLLASIPTPQTNKNQQVVSIPLYYYKIQFDATLSTSAVWLQYVAGIPAPQTIRTHKFPIMAKNRLWLCNNMDNERNTVIFCAENAPDVWNGVDTGKIYFGDDKELTAGCSLYSRFGSNIYHVTLFFKRHSMYGLSGFSPEDFKQYNISESVGCVAPLTLKSIILGIENGQRPIAIWQGANGIYIFDNTTPICISNDISDIFDKNSSTKINPDMIEKSTAFIDYENMEYLFCYAEGSSTTLNKEKVLDLKKLQWFDIDRGTGKYLQCGIEVSDIKGNTYVYGGLDAGYLERLENGTDFDGNDIEHDLWTGDIAPFEGSIMYLTQVLRHKLVMVAKNLTGDTVAITHYGDGNIVGTSLTNVSMANASGRLADKLENWTSDPHIFHSFRYTVTTSNENKGFEPIFIGCKFNIIGEDLE